MVKDRSVGGRCWGGGNCAAPSAARWGPDVTLIERYGHLGWLATGSLVILLLTMEDGDGHQVIRGTCQEVLNRLAARGAAILPVGNERYRTDPEVVERWAAWGKGPRSVRYTVSFDPEELIFTSNDLLKEAKVDLLLHTQAVRMLDEDHRIRGVVVQGSLQAQSRSC